MDPTKGLAARLNRINRSRLVRPLSSATTRELSVHSLRKQSSMTTDETNEPTPSSLQADSLKQQPQQPSDPAQMQLSLQGLFGSVSSAYSPLLRYWSSST